LIILTFIVVLIKVIVLLKIGDKDWQQDSYLHILFVNTVFSDLPETLLKGLGVWQKPLYTYFFSVLGLIFNSHSLIFFKFVNLIICSFTSLIVYFLLRSFRIQKIIIYIAYVLCSLCLLTFRASISVLTEPMLGLTLILAVYYFRYKRWNLACLFMGLTILARLEGFLFIGVLAFYLFIKLLCKEFKFKQLVLCMVILLFPGILWNFTGFLQTGKVTYLITNGYPLTSGIYGYGKWYSYFKGFLILDPLLLFFFSIGLITYIYLIFKSYKKNKHYFLTFLIVNIGIFFLFNTYIWVKSLFGAAGLFRYFVPLVPLMILAGALGIGYLRIDKKLFSLKLNSIQAYCFELILLLITLVAQLGIDYKVIYKGKGKFDGMDTYPDPEMSQNVIDSGKWIRDHIKGGTLMASNWAIVYYAKRNLQNIEYPIINPDFLNYESDSCYIYAITGLWMLQNNRKDILESLPQNFKLVKQYNNEVYIIVYTSKNFERNCEIY
jgi:hypothetical protein